MKAGIQFPVQVKHLLRDFWLETIHLETLE